jgi:hypothetical protein
VTAKLVELFEESAALIYARQTRWRKLDEGGRGGRLALACWLTLRLARYSFVSRAAKSRFAQASFHARRGSLVSRTRPGLSRAVRDCGGSGAWRSALFVIVWHVRDMGGRFQACEIDYGGIVVAAGGVIASSALRRPRDPTSLRHAT